MSLHQILFLICFAINILPGSTLVLPRTNSTSACGKISVVFTGLPPFHPLVAAQGFNSSQVNAGLRNDAADILAAGYNLKVVLMGPEIPIEILKAESSDRSYDGAGIGFGVRGSNSLNMTIRMEQILQTFRETNPNAPVVLDQSPVTGIDAVKRRFPLQSNCANSPGQNLGFDVICNICGTQ
ncbi:hypothetical protein P280DRAFT_470781 [Massarina eburnea CBS 473.64]|uniref:Glycoside hydrolase n=1 Tax=Massarina eburnea CBS 473.64 TaxID=1395130 RepID=A0A6A6RW76_9PLEO|nr:hypothetical protein P280DRAFT_470781 [Massarina eburnea CBS 473.64]